MSLDWESIYQALLVRLQQTLASTLAPPAGPGPFVTIDRRFRLWTEVPDAEQPALFIMQTGGHTTQMDNGGHFGVSRYMLTAKLYLYSKATSAPDAIVSTQMNQLRQAVQDALGATKAMGGLQNLGIPGLITHCWIEGEEIWVEGVVDGDNQNVQVLPVFMLTGNP